MKTKRWAYVFLVLWGITITISLLILPFKWATASFVFVVGISPALSMPIYALFKKFLDTRIPAFRNFFSGLTEAIVWVAFYILISRKFNIPNGFYFFVLAEYLFGQLGRVFRSPTYKYDREEFEELIGFSFALLVFILIIK